MTARSVTRTFYEVHRGLGTVLSLVLFVIAFTGALVVFRAEFDAWGNPGVVERASTGATAGARIGVTRAIEAARGASPLEDFRQVIVLLPDPDGGPYRVRFAPHDGSTRAEEYVDSTTGAALGVRRNLAADFLFDLHAYLLTGSKLGRNAVGLLGLALLVSSVTGLVIHRRRLREALRIEWRRSLRRASADVHKAIGFWGLLFHLLMGLTGAYLGLKDVVAAVPLLARFGGDVAAARTALRDAPPAPAGTSAAMPDVEGVIARARDAVAGLEPNVVLLDAWGDRNARVTVRGTAPGSLLPKHEAFKATFDATSGRLTASESGLEAPAVMRVFHAVAPLHYGNFAGAGVKVLYLVLGLASASLVVSGIVVGASRRRARRGSGPGPVV